MILQMMRALDAADGSDEDKPVADGEKLTDEKEKEKEKDQEKDQEKDKKRKKIKIKLKKHHPTVIKRL